MERELYQLVAIDKNNNQYIIELNNDNKNNRGKLEFIDDGTTRFKNEEHLIQYLFNKGKIPTTDVKLMIKYKHNGDKYLPVIYDSHELRFYIGLEGAAKLDHNERLLLACERAFTNDGFFDYLSNANKKNSPKKENGDYLDNKIFYDLINYYRYFIVKGMYCSESAYLCSTIVHQLNNYKQYRTLYHFVEDCKKINMLNYLKEQDPNPFNKNDDLMYIPDNIRHAYLNNGMDGVYSIVDRDDLEAQGISDIDQLGLKGLKFK